MIFVTEIIKYYCKISCYFKNNLLLVVCEIIYFNSVILVIIK